MNTNFKVLEPAGLADSSRLSCLLIHSGGAKETGIVEIKIERGAKEPRNLQNRRSVVGTDCNRG